MTKPISCDRIGCDNAARFCPVLKLYAHRSHDPAPARLSLKLCETHKAMAKVEDFITDDMWDELCKRFEGFGLAHPKRELTQLDWIELS